MDWCFRASKNNNNFETLYTVTAFIYLRLKTIFGEAVEGVKMGVKLMEYGMNNIGYADTAVLIADDTDDVQQLVNILSRVKPLV